MSRASGSTNHFIMEASFIHPLQISVRNLYHRI